MTGVTQQWVHCCRARQRRQDAVSHVRRHQGDRPGGAALCLQVQPPVPPTIRLQDEHQYLVVSPSRFTTLVCFNYAGTSWQSLRA